MGELVNWDPWNSPTQGERIVGRLNEAAQSLAS